MVGIFKGLPHFLRNDKKDIAESRTECEKNHTSLAPKKGQVAICSSKKQNTQMLIAKSLKPNAKNKNYGRTIRYMVAQRGI